MMAGECVVTCFLLGGKNYLIEVNGETIVFEDHPRLGPCPLRKDGRGERNLGPRHKFWAAASCWYAQGKKLDGLRAIWVEPEPERVRVKKIGRSWVVLSPDDPTPADKELVLRDWP